MKYDGDDGFFNQIKNIIGRVSTSKLLTLPPTKKSKSTKTGTGNLFLPLIDNNNYLAGPASTSADKITMAKNLMRDLDLTAAQAAGIVGNMVAESGVENARVQNSQPGTKGILKINGKTGYGIVQWTSSDRQQNLANYAKSQGADLNKPLTMDIEYQFFLKEFQGAYKNVFNQIKKAKDVKAASTIFMQQYEVPAGYETQEKIEKRYQLSLPIYRSLIGNYF